MTNLILLFSILLNTFGLTGSARNFDRNLVANEFGTGVQAEAAAQNETLPDITFYPTIAKNATTPKIYAEDYIILDSDSGATLLGRKENDRVPIASTTKIMTAIIVLENYHLDDVATVSQNTVTIVSHDGAIPDFFVGEKMTIRNLLWCMLMNSSNVAADTLAEHMNGAGETGITKFVAKMNEKAREFNMKDTNYADPAGLDGAGYSTAYDLTIATRQALKKDLFAEIVKTKKATVTNVSGKTTHQLNNSNRLVNEWSYPGAIGVKTGYMPDDPSAPGAGHCLVAAVKRDGHTLISVVLNTISDTAEASALESRKLQDWAWLNTSW